MLLFIAKRIVAALPILFGVVVVTFVLTRMLPGDPAAYFAGSVDNFKAIEEVRKQLGLDQSLPAQFWSYLVQLSQLDLGTSWATGRPVVTELAERLPASLELTLIALVLGCAIAIPAGVVAATRPDGVFDQIVRATTIAAVSLPAFLIGLMLIFVFYYLLGWVPSPTGRLDIYSSMPPRVTGFLTFDTLLAGDLATFRSAAAQLALPVLSLVLFTLAPLARMTRASMIGALSSDYIRTARAAGLSSYTILVRYGLRNAFLPILSTIGMVFSYALGANVLIEKVFAWPGVGSFALDALMSLDYAPVQGFVLTMALLYVGLNLLIDILYTVVDPRVRMGG